MIHTVYLKTYEAPAIRKQEILRYAGVRGELPELDALLETCLGELEGKLVFRVCYGEFPVTCCGDALDLGFMTASSAALKKNLLGCDSVVVFAATVGMEPDRLIARYGRTSPTKSLLLQAIGAERIESLCDAFQEEITLEKAAEGRGTRPRFSPGYGDFPLAAQREIFRILDCPRKIGLTLNESLLMSPSKSVTALIGITAQPQDGSKGAKCSACAKTDCMYRSME